MGAGQVEGKVALITGAATGIGFTTAQLFAAEGARVVIADMNDAAGEQAAASIIEAGGEARFVHADISDASQVAGMLASTVERFGRIDIAVNNAAVRSDETPVANLDQASWDRLMSIVLTGTTLCVKQELRTMIEQGAGGAIVNITSGTAHRALAGTASYSAAKAGLEVITRVAAVENASHGIRVNSVAPGLVNTPLLTATLTASGMSATEAAAGLNLMNRFADPMEIANAILWLASDKASFVTGTTLHVDGGYTA